MRKQHDSRSRWPDRRLTIDSPIQTINKTQWVMFGTWESGTENPNVKLPGEGAATCYPVVRDLQNIGSGGGDEAYPYYQLPNILSVYDPHSIACVGAGELVPVGWDSELQELVFCVPFGLIRYGETTGSILAGGSGTVDLSIRGDTREIEATNKLTSGTIASGAQVVLHWAWGEGGQYTTDTTPLNPLHFLNVPEYEYFPTTARKGQWEILAVDASAGGDTIPLRVTQVGGSSGGHGSTCSYTYDVEHAVSGTSYYSAVNPTSSPHKYIRHGNVQCSPATEGFGYIDGGTGNLVIQFIHEAVQFAGC